MIFTVFGTTEYRGVQIADIFNNLNYYYDLIRGNFQTKSYQIPIDSRPEDVSFELYGDPNLYWVFYLINPITDPYNEWIKSPNATQETAIFQYRFAGGTEQVDHFVDEIDRRWYDVVENPVGSKNWFSKDAFGNPDRKVYTGTMIPVSVSEFEQNENENRRIIQIIDPVDIRRFVDLLVGVIGS